MRTSFSVLTIAALATLAMTPAAAQNRALGYDLAGLAGETAAPVGPPAAHLVPNDEIDEDIVLPAAPAEPREAGDPDRKWSRDYIAVAAGVITGPRYNGAKDRAIRPGFYLRGRISGYSFSTRGSNFQVDLIRQRRGQKTDWKFGPVITLRADRTGHIDDPAVAALGKRKVALEVGLAAGVTHTGVLTSQYDQIGFRLSGLKDVTGRHGSWSISPTIEYGGPLSKRAYLGMSVSANIYGKGFGRYYYDIDAADSAASGLPVYQRAGNGATIGKYTVGIAGGYALERDLRKGFVLIGGAQYGRIAGHFADSPIVSIRGTADQWLAGGGVAYNF